MPASARTLAGLARQGRNQTFNAAGNLLAAVAMGLLGDFVSNQSIFFLVVGASAVTLLGSGGSGFRGAARLHARNPQHRGAGRPAVCPVAPQLHPGYRI